ncbi:MAG: histone deacetylase family protein [Pseudomonadota bacterium]
MKAFFDPRQRAHAPPQTLVNGAFDNNPEVPERIDHLMAGAKAAGATFARPEDRGLAPIAAIHTPEYLDFLQHIHTRWRRIKGASEAVIPAVHPLTRTAAYPQSAAAQAGWHMADGSCPIDAQTWDAAYWSAQTALAAADCVAAGAPIAYALSRPPGHHAFADAAAGFCYLNNTAIAAEHLRTRGHRPAILDLDVHHGNGTQAIFNHRADILTVSLHADPARFYPFFWGHPQERGTGAGLGANLNLPLPKGANDATFQAALKTALRRIKTFSPTILVVALGLDAHIDDPFKGLAVTTEGFATIGATLHQTGLPLVLVQEGGYVGGALGQNLTSVLTGAMGR